MTKHSPAPWFWGPGSASSTGGYFRVESDDGMSVARVVWPQKVERRQQAIANAHLIAAAPDLLVALKHCRDMMDRSGIGFGPEEELFAAVNRAIYRAEKGR